MDTIIFNANSVSVEGNTRSSDVTVTVEANARDVVEDMAVDDRLYELDARDIIDSFGATKLLQAFTEEELCAWAKDSLTDPVDLLNAIGEESVLEWVECLGADGDSPV